VSHDRDTVWQSVRVIPVRPLPHVVVVGGGISGLAAAHAVTVAGGDSVRVSVLDKAQVVGGHLRLAKVAGITVDAGAESLLNRRPEAVQLVRAVGLEGDLEHPVSAEAGLWSRGSIVALPTGTVMGVPSDAGELADVLLADEVKRVAAEPTVPGLPLDHDVAVGTLVAERMGPAVTDQLVEPFLGGVYAGRAAELSFRATMPELASAAARHRSLLKAAASVRDGAPDVPVFAGIRGGVGRLAAVAVASGAEIRTGTTVRRISRLPAPALGMPAPALGDAGSAHRPTSSASTPGHARAGISLVGRSGAGAAGGWRIETGPVSAAATIDADAVIVAVPATPAARMLRDLVPAAAAELAAVEYASVAIVTLVIPATGFPQPPRWSGYLIPPVDGHVTKAVTISSVKWGWLAESADDLVVLRASIGRHREQADLQHEDRELVNTVLAELTDAIGVTGPPVDAHVSRWGGALPQYAVGHVGRMARVRAAVEAVPGLAVCGAAYDGVGVAACVASAQRAANRVLQGLGLVSVSGP
jgi:protoporphyrinogen/coproporphyrinogen III oxidase